MAFNIHQRVFDKNGEYIEKVALQYQKQLLQLFVQSPEGKALQEEGIEPGWSDMMMHYGINYLSVTPTTMTSSDLREILLDLFPRKVSASAEEAPAIIHELQFFWQFLQREFQLQNAAACLKVLDKKMERQLKSAMSNPANFDLAKSFVTMGQQRGFDMTTEEGMNEWMNIYNAELAAGTGSRIPFPGSPFSGFPASASEFLGEQSQGARATRDKLKRKMESASRRKNRRKR